LLGQQPLVVEPGQFAAAEVEVPTKGLEGRIEKQFAVLTDAADPKLQTILLQLSAQVLRPIKAVPSTLHFGIVHPGATTAAKRIVILIRESGLIDAFRSVESDNLALAVSVVGQQRGMITLEVQLADGLPNCDLNGKVTLRFEHERFDEFILPVVGRVASDLQVIPNRVVLGPRTRGNQRLRVKSNSVKRFRIIQATSPPGFNITVDNNNAPTDIHYLAVTKSSSTSARNAGFITLRTDHPQQPTLLIPVEEISVGTK
jgi:hypothetical protein